MFLANYQPSEIIGYLGSVSVYWYGLLLACAVIAGYYVTFFLMRKERAHVEKIFFTVFVSGLIGARLVFVLYHLDYFLLHPFDIFQIWQGGIVWHGALLGAGIAIAAYCRMYKLSFLHISDRIVPGLALGQSIGRWGNFFNQENYGLPTDHWLGIPIDAFHRLPGYEAFSTFHPTFLYESIGDLILFFILLAVAQRSAIFGQGYVTAVYIILYSLMRLFIEFIRIDSVPIMFGFRMPQIISIFLIVITCACIVLFKKQKVQRSS